MFFISLAIGSGWHGTSNHSGKHYHRRQVWGHEQKVGWNRGGQDLELELEYIGKPKNQARRQRAERGPVSKDHGGECDKTASVGHRFVKATNGAECQKTTGEPGQ